MALVSRAQTPLVNVIVVDGSINPASADYIHEQIEVAQTHGTECLVIKLNTPGGLLKSTRMIVSDFLAARVPIIVYVSPSGSQAASAGVFVTLAANIAVMAPGTNIGAAHPVLMGEQQDSIMMEKATNDAAAFIRTISEKRNRNIKWAEDAVRKSLSITETEALRENIIDTIATSIDDLLQKIDGREVHTSSGAMVLKTRGAVVNTIERTFIQTFLDILSDPNIAYIFMMLGIYGLLFEIYNPGLIFPGIVGFVSLVLAFYSLHTLPINYAGLALIIFGVILFLLEVKIVSHGLLAVGGTVSVLLGSAMLIRTESVLDVMTLSWKVILISVVVTALFFIFVIGLGLRAQRRRPTTGIQGLIGEIGVALSDLDPRGTVRVHGEIWSAESTGGISIPKTSKVRIESIENLMLKVRKLEA